MYLRFANDLGMMTETEEVLKVGRDGKDQVISDSRSSKNNQATAKTRKQ